MISRMLNLSQFDGSNEGRLQINGSYSFHRIKLCRVIMLILGIEFLHMNDLDFVEKQIYGVDYGICEMVTEHKKL